MVLPAPQAGAVVLNLLLAFLTVYIGDSDHSDEDQKAVQILRRGKRAAKSCFVLRSEAAAGHKALADEAPGSFDAPTREGRNNFAARRCLRFFIAVPRSKHCTIGGET